MTTLWIGPSYRSRGKKDLWATNKLLKIPISNQSKNKQKSQIVHLYSKE